MDTTYRVLPSGESLRALIIEPTANVCMRNDAPSLRKRKTPYVVAGEASTRGADEPAGKRKLSALPDCRMNARTSGSCVTTCAQSVAASSPNSALSARSSAMGSVAGDAETSAVAVLGGGAL